MTSIPGPGSSAIADIALEILQALSEKSAQAQDDHHQQTESDSVLTAERFAHVPFDTMKASLDRLSSRSMVKYDTIEREYAILEPEAESIITHGSHESRVLEALHKTTVNRDDGAGTVGLTLRQLEQQVGDKAVTKVGTGKAFREKWIKKEGDRIVALVDSVHDVTQDQLRTIQAKQTHPEAEVLAALKKRKLIKMAKQRSFRITKGPKYALEIPKEETDLTADMLASGSWKTGTFKPYNFNALGADPDGGALHPLEKVKTEFRQIFFEMGFEEMPTSNFVQSGFWNFDALFVPQQHPARDLQDTFHLRDPVRADPPGKGRRARAQASDDETSENDEENKKLQAYWENIREVHENGKYGSLGYRYPWSEDEALKLVLRTHTTANSAAMLYKLAQKNGPGSNPPPARYFSIDRVFRNETVDATHLAEFHQVEGIIADYDLTLGGLIEFMRTFFAKMGMTSLKFKPAYNPYTEPSMEIFAWHAGLGKLIEVGNSGMFRPEVLEPMGFPPSMRVYGWGLSLERPTMVKYGISNIRQLVGSKVDLNFIRQHPAVRLDKD